MRRRRRTYKPFQLLDGLCMEGHEGAQDDAQGILRGLASQRMNGEPLTIGGYSLGHTECTERWHGLPDELEEARDQSPYRDSETIDWWTRAGRPWPMSVQ